MEATSGCVKEFGFYLVIDSLQSISVSIMTNFGSNINWLRFKQIESLSYFLVSMIKHHFFNWKLSLKVLNYYVVYNIEACEAWICWFCCYFVVSNWLIIVFPHTLLNIASSSPYLSLWEKIMDFLKSLLGAMHRFFYNKN